MNHETQTATMTTPLEPGAWVERHGGALFRFALFRLRDAALEGKEKKPFTFSTIGLLAATGRRTGVAQIMGWQFSGFFAWFLWRTIYLSKLPRLEKKVRVALDWTLDRLFSKDLVQFQPLRAPTVSHAPDQQRAVARVAAPSTTSAANVSSIALADQRTAAIGTDGR